MEINNMGIERQLYGQAGGRRRLKPGQSGRGIGKDKKDCRVVRTMGDRQRRQCKYLSSYSCNPIP